jgi:Protein of unknown function (DUF2630)
MPSSGRPVDHDGRWLGSDCSRRDTAAGVHTGGWCHTGVAVPHTVGGMDDKQILGHIDELISAEHQLRTKLAAGELTSEEEHAQLRSTEEALDQCWDLLRQRRARREFGEDPTGAISRPANEVEGYLQ